MAKGLHRVIHVAIPFTWIPAPSPEFSVGLHITAIPPWISLFQRFLYSTQRGMKTDLVTLVLKWHSKPMSKIMFKCIRYSEKETYCWPVNPIPPPQWPAHCQPTAPRCSSEDVWDRVHKMVPDPVDRHDVLYCLTSSLPILLDHLPGFHRQVGFWLLSQR